MNDLQQIDRANARAIANNIPDLQARGCWVVTEYAGLHIVGAEIFSGEDCELRAQAKLAELNASGNSTHGVLHPAKPQIMGTYDRGTDDTAPCEAPPAGCCDNAPAPAAYGV